MLQKNLLYEQFIVAKLNRGDSDAFSEIFSAYYKDLVLFAFSFTKEMESAEEIVQETFVKLWEDREKLDVKISLKSVLLKTVQNRCIDWYRHKKIMNNYCDYVQVNKLLFENDTDNYLLWSELNELIKTALSRMPEKYREAYEMNRNDGLKYQEIAESLSVSVRTVEVRISGALEFLRKELIDFL
jgi:RNA polymerase sigma-70 factor (family 1)